MIHPRPILFVAAAFILGGAVIPARAELPPLIPREILFANPARVAPSLSPDGTRLAYLAGDGGDGVVLNIWVQTVGADDARQVTHDTHRGIFEYHWAWDNRHLLYVQDRDGDENWHLYSVDLEGGEPRDLTPFPGVQASNLLADVNHPDEVLVGLNKRDPKSVDMYRIRLSTGEATLETENPGDVDTWATDTDFRIRAATALDARTNDTILRVRDTPDSPWRDLVRWPFLEAGSVLYEKILGFTPDGKGLYVQSPMGSEMTRLVVLDTTTGKEVRELASDPKSDVWNVWWNPQVVINPVTHEVEAVGFDYLKPRWEVVDPKVSDDFHQLQAEAGDGIFAIAGHNRDDTIWLVKFISDTAPERYAVYHRDTRKLDPLFTSLPELAKYTLSPMLPKVIPARDGLQLPCYLTLPVGVEPKGLPMVLLPHGGPWAQDDWGFESWGQFLANRGYAVLQVNFRGSTGYGKNHLNAGNLQWAGNMLNDLTDAVHWAVEQGIADPSRIGIMGGSYGGYATLCGIAFTPDLYACAVDMVGPSNVKTLFQSFPPYWSVRKVRWMRRVGDVEHDDELNRRISPVFHADAIRAPLLIAHGTNDPRVHQAESDGIVAAMRKNHLDVTYVVYPDEGHGLGRAANSLDFMGRVEEFLAQHLGGRKEPWRQEEGTSAEVR